MGGGVEKGGFRGEPLLEERLASITLEADGVPMEAYVSAPLVGGPFPGVVVAHHQYGLSPFTKKIVGAVAELGCAAISVNHFHHSPPDADLEAKKKELRDSRIVNDIAAAIEHLESRQDVDGSRIAILGHCMGGRTSFLAASLFSALSGAVVYYSGGMFTSRGNEGPTAFETLNGIRCPVIGFFGARDKNPSPDDVVKIGAELTRCGIEHEFHSYPNAGHAFCDADNPKQYDAAAAQDSWSRTVRFLYRHLGFKGVAKAKTAMEPPSGAEGGSSPKDD